MTRLRLNNQSDKTSGTITFADGSTTTGTFAVAPGFATLSGSDYYVLTVDPDTATEEIVHLTGYTAGATTGTFLRAQGGTTGVAHSAKPWSHGPTTNDFVPSVFDSTQDGKVVAYDHTTASGLAPSASYVLTPTAVKTANYTAVAFDFVPCDTATTGSFTVTLPNAPADKTLVGVEQVAQSGTRAVTVACAGSDVFDVASGATTKLLTMLGQGTYLQYKASSAIWYTVANRQPVMEIPTAKGDLLVATASGVLARQAVGADTNVLTADSTQTGGVGWVPPLFAKPTAALYETFARAAAATTSFLVSGTLQLSAIMLPSGLVVTSISFATASTALAAGTTPHLWFALYDSSLALLRQSTDDTSPVWAANTLKTYNLSSTFTTTYSGLHYIGMMNANASGGTLPALVAAAPGTAIVGLAPNLGGTSSTAQTTTAPNPAAAITAAKLVYGYVS